MIPDIPDSIILVLFAASVLGLPMWWGRTKEDTP